MCDVAPNAEKTTVAEFMGHFPLELIFVLRVKQNDIRQTNFSLNIKYKFQNTYHYSCGAPNRRTPKARDPHTDRLAFPRPSADWSTLGRR